MRSIVPLGLALAVGGLLVLAAGRALSTSAGPQAGLTGVPAGGGLAAEATCTSCHSSFELNADGRGKVELRGLSERFAPGERYTLTFAIAHPDPDRLRWGFQLTAIDTETYRGAGRFVVTDPARTQVVGGLGERQYIEHTYPGTGIGRAGGQSWTFDWIAPGDASEVAFYASASASNVDGSQNGDRIYNSTPEPLARIRGTDLELTQDPPSGPAQ